MPAILSNMSNEATKAGTAQAKSEQAAKDAAWKAEKAARIAAIKAAMGSGNVAW